MSDTNLPRLKGAPLLELMVATERRNRGRREGIPDDQLPPYPPCPVCQQPVDSQETTLGTADVDDRVATNQPCGHQLAFNLNVTKQMVPHVQWILDRDEQPAEETRGQDPETELASLRREVAAARKFAAEMRNFCSPHGVATDYANRLIEAMDRAKGERRDVVADILAAEWHRRHQRLEDLAKAPGASATVVEHVRGELIGLRGALGVLLGGQVEGGTADLLGWSYYQEWRQRQEARS